MDTLRGLARLRAATLLGAAVVLAACGQAAAPALALAPSAAVRADTVVTDIVGRQVRVRTPVERMVLGEGRQLYVVATLEPEDPFRHVAAWPDDLRTTDFDAYTRYKAKFPAQVAKLPVLGNPNAGAMSAEAAIALRPDVLVLNFDAYAKSQEVGLIAQLEKAGIPTVVIDYRQYPFENTVPSTLLLGKLLGQEARAQEVVDFYLQQINQVYALLDRVKSPAPNVFLYRAGGITDCCGTFGRANLGLLLERAGGKNLGSDLVPGWSGTLNPEKVRAADPQMVIATGSNWTYNGSNSGFVSLGYGAATEDARRQLRALVAGQAGWANLQAVRTNQLFAIWHQFYNSPYNFVALQQFAKWLHPAEFREVDPAATFAEFHRRFLPIDFSGAFWVAAQP